MSSSNRNNALLLLTMLLVLATNWGSAYAEDSWSRYSSYRYDTDQDGVSNRYDMCPDTPSGATVNSNGCPRDSDGDGVYDGLDQCPNTTAGTPVNSVGCTSVVDSDGDGIPDSQDPCPNDPANGCVDSDGDGTPDNQDPCPNDPANGCVDSDGDGMPDSQDPCPNDPSNSCGGSGGGSGGTPSDPAVCPPGQSREPNGLSIMGQCRTPADCFNCHKDAQRFPVLNRSIMQKHPQHANFLTNCFDCHTVQVEDVGVVAKDGCLAACHLNLTDLPTNNEGLPITVVGSPDSGTNRHHYTDTFKNESCHRCHVFPDTQLTSSEICITCHNGDVAKKNILASFQQPYAHPLDVLGRVAGNGDQVSCLDCHNPNKVTSDNRLRGVEGVEPVWPGNWEPITNYNAVASVEKQYQLCFKCHSSFKFGDSPPYDAFGKMMTDIAKEFNPNNASHHAVVAPGKNDFKMGSTDYSSALIGGYTPNSVLECDDCHRDSAQPTVEGPHGSGVYPILQKPFTANTGKGSSNDLCFKCHDPNVYGVYGESGRGKTGYSGGGEGNLHAYHVGDKGAKCQTCHAAVPHGWKRRHLLIRAVGGSSTNPADPAPYNGQAGSSRPSGINVRVNVDSIESGTWREDYCHGPGTGSCDD